MMFLAAMKDEQWELGIGDPTPMGWLTVFAYFFAAWLCFRARSAANRHSGGKSPDGHRLSVLWTGLFLLLIALGINKQLDLQSFLTYLGKRLAKEQGWYRQRRAVQTIFVGIVAGVGLIASGLVLWLARRSLRQVRLALVGTAFLVSFVVVRAASFHHIDVLLGETWLGLQVNWLLELGGIACIGASAWCNGGRFRARPG